MLYSFAWPQTRSAANHFADLIKIESLYRDGRLAEAQQLYDTRMKSMLAYVLKPHHLSEDNFESKMRLYQAGSFAGENQRAMLYSVGPASVLFSYAHKTARDTCWLVAGEEGQEKMKLYLAGDWSPELHEQVCDAAGEKNLLCTNAAKASRARADHFSTKPNYRILVDSGAFTAYKQGTVINLDEYIAYAKELTKRASENTLIEFIGLDVIAGTSEQGKTGTIPHEEKERACQVGFDNYLKMKEAGIPCIPTFHRDDEHVGPQEWYWFDQIFDAVQQDMAFGGSGRVCLAPRVDGSPTYVKMRWLNSCFLRLIDRYGKDALTQFKIHGLGISSIEMMETFPFYSVDSTGWLWAAVNTTYKRFDGTYMKNRAKSSGGEPQNWYLPIKRKNGKSMRHASPRTVACVDKYRTQEQGCENGLAGGYWSGAQAIVADVRLESHVTRLWTDKEIVFND